MGTTTETQVISLDSPLARRALLGGGLAVGGVLLGARWWGKPEAVAPVALSPRAPAPRPVVARETRLALRCVHTDRRCDALLMRGAAFDDQGVAELNDAMRDWRTHETIAMDRDLLVLLSRLRESLDARTPFNLISGYRSPHTNAALGAGSGEVAKKSQHMLGKAADIALPGVAIERIRDAAMALGAGGVGYYPRDGFVHVDTARVRFW